MKIVAWLALGMMALGLGGCYTSALGSAPAPDPNYIYVAGRRSNPAAMWVCPAHKTGENCQLVKVKLAE